MEMPKSLMINYNIEYCFQDSHMSPRWKGEKGQ